MDTIKKLAAAGALVGFLAVGGMSLASAQEDPTSSTTPSTTVPSTTETAPAPGRDGDCPKDGSGGADAPAPATGSSSDSTPSSGSVTET